MSIYKSAGDIYYDTRPRTIAEEIVELKIANAELKVKIDANNARFDEMARNYEEFRKTLQEKSDTRAKYWAEVFGGEYD